MASRKSASETSDARGVMHIPLNAKTQRLINDWCDRTGGSKTRFIQRLAEWYAETPESLQAIIFGGVPDDMQQAYADRAAAYFADLVKRRGRFISSGGDAIEDRASQGTVGQSKNSRKNARHGGRARLANGEMVDVPPAK